MLHTQKIILGFLVLQKKKTCTSRQHPNMKQVTPAVPPEDDLQPLPTSFL